MSAPRDPLAQYFTHGWSRLNALRGLPVLTSSYLPPDTIILGYPEKLRDAFARVELLVDSNFDLTTIVYRDEYERMGKAFWARLDPQLRRLEHEARARWDHMSILADIDPAAFVRGGWEATPHGLVSTRSGCERPTVMEQALARLRDDRRPYGEAR